MNLDQPLQGDRFSLADGLKTVDLAIGGSVGKAYQIDRKCVCGAQMTGDRRNDEGGGSGQQNRLMTINLMLAKPLQNFWHIERASSTKGEPAFGKQRQVIKRLSSKHTIKQSINRFTRLRLPRSLEIAQGEQAHQDYQDAFTGEPNQKRR